MTQKHFNCFGDAISHLNLPDTIEVKEYTADYGKLSNMSQANPDHNICFIDYQWG
eukprot:CAMPEP_0168220336 /NCGR_PEP_ID=MMETSP0140_2-20121125/9163_1 /TAXON_ID=44445 /ORGANISM="Pseudo-nitzschia australis, Strain 10249 10 AB" /LENGTH=54 /DNA_ID=CAMNT_0008149025 /DNA_START=1218 /DNA_END=1382 /DNA_ORIENTATION=-